MNKNKNKKSKSSSVSSSIMKKNVNVEKPRLKSEEDAQQIIIIFFKFLA